MKIYLNYGVAVAFVFSLVLCGCGDSENGYSCYRKIQAFYERGGDPRPDFDAIRGTYIKFKGTLDGEALRALLVDFYYSWGAFDEALNFYNDGCVDLKRSGERMLLIKSIKAGKLENVSGNEAAPLGRFLRKLKDEDLRTEEFETLCSMGDLSIPTLLSLALLKIGDNEKAMYVSRGGLLCAQTALGIDHWDGVDHGRDMGEDQTAYSIVLMKVYGLSASRLNIHSQGHELSAQDATAISISMKASFGVRRRSFGSEVPFLAALWALAEQTDDPKVADHMGSAEVRKE
jgi:hypothetical protein